MKTTQLFNPDICFKNNCEYLRAGYCFGILEDCKINKKAGYPREIDRRKQWK